LKSAIFNFTDRNVVEFTIKPILKLVRPIECYLPPAGRYYNENTIALNFQNVTLDIQGRCTSCWSPKHAQSMRNCVFLCLICHTKNHSGQEYSMVFAARKWWIYRGHTPPHTFNTRPTASEFAYLIVAGVIKRTKSLYEPIVVNMDHPLVQELYAVEAAQVILPGDGKKRVSREPGVTLASSLVRKDGADRAAHAPAHDKCNSRIAELEAEKKTIQAVLSRSWQRSGWIMSGS
jgi:hypothetical protein